MHHEPVPQGLGPRVKIVASSVGRGVLTDEPQPLLLVAGNGEMAEVWREQARVEDDLYNEHRQRSNDTAFVGSNIGRQLEHTVRNPKAIRPLPKP